MNIINTLLILFIILIIINNLTNKNILNTITNYFNNIKNIISNKPEKIKQESFDTILNKLIVKTNKPNENLNLIVASKSMVKILEKKLLKVFNNHFNKYNYKFHNLIINDNIEYATTLDGKYFRPFNFSVKVYYKNKKLDTLFLKTELFVKKDTNVLLILNINKEQYNAITDILTENNDNMNNFINQNQVEVDDATYNNFNSMFIQQDNTMYNNVHETDNNSSLIPNINEINITNNSADSSYSTSTSS